MGKIEKENHEEEKARQVESPRRNTQVRTGLRTKEQHAIWEWVERVVREKAEEK